MKDNPAVMQDRPQKPFLSYDAEKLCRRSGLPFSERENGRIPD